MKLSKKIVLAYSGGLDTSIILKWLQENYNSEIIAYTADIGQTKDTAKNLLAKSQVSNPSNSGFNATVKPLGSSTASRVYTATKDLQFQGNLKGGEYLRKISGKGAKGPMGSVVGSRGSGNVSGRVETGERKDNGHVVMTISGGLAMTSRTTIFPTVADGRIGATTESEGRMS